MSGNSEKIQELQRENRELLQACSRYKDFLTTYTEQTAMFFGALNALIHEENIGALLEPLFDMGKSYSDYFYKSVSEYEDTLREDKNIFL